MGVAGLRALLLQALHPLAMAGVDQHSAFQQDPWGRLARTAEYVGVTTFGSTAAALSAGARVRMVHQGMSGVEPESSESYRVEDPELLAWVHCCLVDSFLQVGRRGGLAISDVDADTYVREQIRAAALVGLEPGDVPGDVGSLDWFFEGRRPRLRVTGAARRAAGYVVAPPMPPALVLTTPARPAWASVAGLAFATLPEWARRMYALPELRGAAALHGAATTLALRTLRTSLRGAQAIIPPLREGPHLREARRRLAPPSDGA